eukprot:TRINITY_DN13609_c0_g1_i1.p1 TRINITY_DN13609_c0_g1~~TRINITY_DN13609_c0_g1_i1.p1  ORF type:complete len:512 (-),score=93.50 TRINITY_DN13609_c0_g1_i1:39-1574(-)
MQDYEQLALKSLQYVRDMHPAKIKVYPRNFHSIVQLYCSENGVPLKHWRDSFNNLSWFVTCMVDKGYITLGPDGRINAVLSTDYRPSTGSSTAPMIVPDDDDGDGDGDGDDGNDAYNEAILDHEEDADTTGSACPICSITFASNITPTQINLHIDECLTTSMLTEEDTKKKTAPVSSVIVIDDVDMAFSCPFPGCVGLGRLEPLTFVSHIATKHSSDPIQPYFCPLCAMIGEDMDGVDESQLHLWRHICRIHPDLVRKHAYAPAPAPAPAPTYAPMPAPFSTPTPIAFPSLSTPAMTPLVAPHREHCRKGSRRPGPAFASQANPAFTLHTPVMPSFAAPPSSTFPFAPMAVPMHPQPPPAPVPFPFNAPFIPPTPSSNMFMFPSLPLPTPVHASNPFQPPHQPAVISPMFTMQPVPPQREAFGAVVTPTRVRPAFTSTSTCAPASTHPAYVEQVLQKPLVDQDCTICFEDFASGQTVFRLECMCLFHKVCIQEWFVKKPHCPLHVPADCPK